MKPRRSTLFVGDCLRVLRKIPLSGCVDLIVTDPPYALTSVNPRKPGGGSGTGGFMGKKWDAAVPSVEVWCECLRVLKPGGFAFVLCGPRQDGLAKMITNLEEAGFVIGYTSLYWCQAAGFPKSQNLSKAADRRAGAKRKVVGVSSAPNSKEGGYKGKRYKGERRTKFGVVQDQPDATEPATDEAKQIDGAYAGWQPKPAVEVVLVAMKPLAERTYLDQAISNGKGCTWLDDCRIPVSSDSDAKTMKGKNPGRSDLVTSNVYGSDRPQQRVNPDSGRFPANLLCCDDSLNSGSVHRGSGGGGTDRVTDNNLIYGKGLQKDGWKSVHQYHDSGSFSRYFDLDAWWAQRVSLLPEAVQRTFPFLIVPKASKREKNEGLEGLVPKKAKPLMGEFATNPGRTTPKSSPTPRANSHPTVKPLKLMSYLVTLGSREHEIVLDPYAGSGTTGVAAKLLNRRFVGVELYEEYATIARHRIGKPVRVIKTKSRKREP